MKRKIVNLSKEVNDEIGRKCLIKMSFVKVIAKAAIFMALGGKVGSQNTESSQNTCKGLSHPEI